LLLQGPNDASILVIETKMHKIKLEKFTGIPKKDILELRLYLNGW